MNSELRCLEVFCARVSSNGAHGDTGGPCNLVYMCVPMYLCLDANIIQAGQAVFGSACSPQQFCVQLSDQHNATDLGTCCLVVYACNCVSIRACAWVRVLLRTYDAKVAVLIDVPQGTGARDLTVLIKVTRGRVQPYAAVCVCVCVCVCACACVRCICARHQQAWHAWIGMCACLHELCVG